MKILTKRFNLQNQELQIMEQFTQILEDLDNQNIFESFTIANSLEYINQVSIFSKKYFKVRYDANFIVSGFRINQFTAFDFYEIFLDFYHNQQLQMLKIQEKISNNKIFYQIYKIFQYFSIFLAIDMSKRQLIKLIITKKENYLFNQLKKREILKSLGKIHISVIIKMILNTKHYQENACQLILKAVYILSIINPSGLTDKSKG
ncbi:unnamed protein product [Paramecium pentaurelia]|uniref:Uncharacterized protein n=1 Tax=Paramecium pentaurelia TaxID=43138 RepID=A0A8S1XSB3_9CILI|nr:unnamed protein product [Paramecium pentaurelia]